MSIPSGSPPSITCYTRSDSIDSQENGDTTLIKIFSTIYSDFNCTNKIGTCLEEIQAIVNSSNVVTQYYDGTLLFDKFGNINFQTCEIPKPGQTEYTNQIIFGTEDFLNCKGYKYTINELTTNTNINYIYIETK
jgi:hypothetical protein